MSPEPQIERSMLDGKDRDELHQIAGAMGLRGVTRLRKAELVDAILAAATSGPAAGSAPSGNGSTAANGKRSADAAGQADAPAAADAGDSADASKARRVRSKKASELDDDPIAALAAEEDALVSGDGDAPDVVPVRRRAGAATGAKAKGGSDTAAADTAADAAAGTAAPTADGEGSGTGAEGSGPDATGASTPAGDAATSTSDSSSAAGTDAPPEGRDDRQGQEGNRRRRRRRRPGDRDRAHDGGGEPAGEPVAVEGLLDLRDEGYGFLRATGYLAGPRDSYVSASQVRRFALRKGDHVKGMTRPPASNEKYPALLKVEEVNGLSPDDARQRPRFEDLTPLFPDEKLRLELPDAPLEITGRIVDLISPIGKGQRGLIVSPPKAGKTTILKQLVYSIERNNPEVHLMVLLVDERPEEVTDMRRHVLRGEVVASTFDRPSEEHTHVAELTIERAKRLVELGRDVVIVLDGITRLARAYNLAAPASGRILSGGVDSTALYPPKRFFGAARNIEEGGSLTIVATALIETGSKMDEVIFEEFKGTGNMELRLDRKLSERRIYPSIDVEQSSTRHEELLFERGQLQQVWKLRRVLNALGADGGSGPGIELLIDKLRTTKSNDEFLAEIAKAPTAGG